VKKGIKYLRHQLLTNITIDKTFLQASIMGYSRGLNARGRFGFTAALDSLRYSGGLNKIIRPVRLSDTQESRRTNARGTVVSWRSDEDYIVLEQIRRENIRILGERRERSPPLGNLSFSLVKSQYPSQAALDVNAI